MVRRALYTVLLGKYEHLNPLPEVAQHGVDAFCFSDDPDLRSSTWNIVHVAPVFALDSVRSQRLIKILGHPVLKPYDETLFIDVSVRLKVDPNEILDSWLANSDVAIPEHSYRASVEDEFSTVVADKLDSRERVTEQLAHYRELFADSLVHQPLWTAIMARRTSPAVDEFSRVWAEHVLRYSRRDQLSVLVAAHLSGVSVNRISLDNFDSDLHQWPVRSEHRTEIRATDLPDYWEMLQSSQREANHITRKRDHLKNERDLFKNERDLFKDERDLFKNEWEQTQKTLSWRLTKPLRMIRRLWSNS